MKSLDFTLIREGNTEMKKRIAGGLLSLLLLLPCLAGAEGPLPRSTETDLCPHENVRSVFYFDSPVYRSVNVYNHSVSGPATVQEVCEDCGAVLSSVVRMNATEIREHIYRRGSCVLCGREAPQREEAASREKVIPIAAQEEEPDKFICALSAMDLREAGEVLVLRPEEGVFALEVQVKPLQVQMDTGGGNLIAELSEPLGARQLTASVRWMDEDGTPITPDDGMIALRVYDEQAEESLTVMYAGPEEAVGRESAVKIRPEGENEEDYWSVTWLGDGTYSY